MQAASSRLLSSRQAGFSGRALQTHHTLRADTLLQHPDARAFTVTRAVGPEKRSPFSVKPGHFWVEDLHNREPDYSDPDWFDKVTDWDDYWNFTRWDLETEQLSDDLDVGGHPTRTVERAYAMHAAMRSVETRPDVLNIVPSQIQRSHTNAWDDPPVAPEEQEPLPDWDYNDWRALAEKQRFKDLMDAEWRRRQAKIGKLSYPSQDPISDVRFRRFDYMGETLDWNHDEIYALITQNGTACKPEDHKAIVENPLIPVDFPNTMGVTYIEETEEVLERTGHMADMPPLELLERELVVDLNSGLAPAELVAALLVPEIQAMDDAQAEEEWRAEEGTWTGDA